MKLSSCLRCLPTLDEAEQPVLYPNIEVQNTFAVSLSLHALILLSKTDGRLKVAMCAFRDAMRMSYCRRNGDIVVLAAKVCALRQGAHSLRRQGHYQDFA